MALHDFKFAPGDWVRVLGGRKTLLRDGVIGRVDACHWMEGGDTYAVRWFRWDGELCRQGFQEHDLELVEPPAETTTT